jgi:hypothetical protein
VTISGTNFSVTPANNTVKFNGTTAVVTTSSATQITTTVPDGASTGKITVEVSGNTATSSSDFTVTVPITVPIFAGYYYDSNNYIPCYWAGDERIPLNLTNADAGRAWSPVAIVGSTVYVVGEYYSSGWKPCYWVATSTGSTRHDITIPTDATSYDAVGIAVEGGSVYIAGHYSYEYEPGLYTTRVCLWTNNGSAVPISDPTEHAWARAITVSSGTVYIAGRYLDTTNSTYEACYWTGTGKTALPEPAYSTYDSSDVESTAITVSGGKVYVTGTFRTSNGNTWAYKPCYWEDNNAAIVLNGAPFDGNYPEQFASTIAVDGGDVYVAGWYTTGTSDGACYWKNGEIFFLTSPSLSNPGPYTSAMMIIDGTLYFGGGYYAFNNTTYDYWRACFWTGTARTDLDDYTQNAYIQSWMLYGEESTYNLHPNP